MKEIWKDIPEYEGLYQVSNKGNVKSISHYTRNNVNGGKRYAQGRVLSQFKMPNGYRQVQFSKNEKREKKYVHRLVASVFLLNEDNLTDVNHIDGNKDNNTVENLEWVSHRDNQIHMVENGLTKKVKPVIHIETGKTYRSMTEAERLTGIDRHKIKDDINQGVRWRFVDCEE